MDFDLEDKVAIVTGSAQGIGKATATELAKNGCTVYCLDIKDDENNKTVSEIKEMAGGKCIGFHCDIAEPEEINTVFDSIINTEPRIDYLINNAAVFSQMSFVKNSYTDALNDYEFNMNINARGTFLCAKKVAPVMAKAGQGHIINVNTNHVKRYLFSVSKDEHSYDASKYAQMAINESMAMELIQYGIKVNAICPAATRTPMLNDFFPKSELPLTAEKMGKATRIPSLLEPEEVAKAICGMLSWPDSAPVGKEYLVMFSKDCEKLCKGPVETFAK